MTTPAVTPPTVSPIAPQPPIRHTRLRRSLLVVAGVLAVLFIGIQLIPINRTNPPVTTQIMWDSPQTEALARRACMDCHSNETTWPWYSYVAPVSWLVYLDTQRGRDEMNLSTYSAASSPISTNLSSSTNGQFVTLTTRPSAAGGQLSEDGSNDNLADRLAEQIQEGDMPPAIYTLLHPTAILTTGERQQLIQGLLITLRLTAP